MKKVEGGDILPQNKCSGVPVTVRGNKTSLSTPSCVEPMIVQPVSTRGFALESPLTPRREAEAEWPTAVPSSALGYRVLYTLAGFYE